MSAIFECPDCGQILYFPAIPCFVGIHVLCDKNEGNKYKHHPGVHKARRDFLENVKQREAEQKQLHEAIQQLNDLIMYHPGLQGPGFRAAQDHFETGRKRLRSHDDDSYAKRPKSTTDVSTSNRVTDSSASDRVTDSSASDRVTDSSASDRVTDSSASDRVTDDSERVCTSLDSEEE